MPEVASSGVAGQTESAAQSPVLIAPVASLESRAFEFCSGLVYLVVWIRDTAYTLRMLAHMLDSD